MEDYVAVSSLAQTIKCLKDSRVMSFSSRSTAAIMSVLEETVESLVSTRESENDLPGQIKDAVLEMEDVLESHISNQFLSSQSEDSSPLQMSSFCVDLDGIKQDVDSFAQTIYKMLSRGSSRSNNDDDDDDDNDDDDDDVPSGVDFGGSLDDQYFGLSDQFTEIKYLLTHELPSDKPKAVLLRGMAGIGKTALAKKLFHDPEVSSRYEKRVFVTVGQKYRYKRVLKDIQKQAMDPQVDGENMLIVLDDIWDSELPDQLFDSDNIWSNRAVTILLTSRRDQFPAYFRFTIRFMDKKESWDLLRHKVFDKTSPCPPQLEKAGKKIAEKCEGLPLTIVTVANIMSKAKADEKTTTEEYWNKVATEKRNSVFTDAYDQMFEVLYQSYNYLRIKAKPCFLFLGSFPQKDEISCSKLIKFFLVEGLYCPYIFEEFVLNSMIIVHDKSLVVNSCSLHSSFWHMCNKEARKIKLFRGVDIPDDVLAEEDDLKGQRRLCIRDNIVLAFKGVYNSIASISKLRSLVCTGPYHQYPVPICLEYLRSLRVLDALTIRFYEFPIQALMKLVHLRYLALTYDGNLPASIFKLYSLQCLIVHRHQSIIVGNPSSYLPMEIWSLKELKYLHIMGGNLPKPSLAGHYLQNLETLLDVSHQSCTKDVLQFMPNLLELGIRIELAPDNNDEPLCFFDHISHLRCLQKLKCIIVYPKMMSTLPPLPIFPKYLNELTLSGFGYPWKDICKIAQLPKLEVLKLQCYAFRGPKWEVDHGDFPNLRYLLIEDSDLVQLTFYEDGLCLLRLEQLVIKHCYKLQEIPLNFGEYLKRIELVECNTLVVASAIQVKVDMDQRYPQLPMDLNVHSTWDK